MENQLVTIFLNHRCYCHDLGIPRIIHVSAKYKVILHLATTCTCMAFLSNKSHREEGEEKKSNKGFRAIARKPKNKIKRPVATQ